MADMADTPSLHKHQFLALAQLMRLGQGSGRYRAVERVIVGGLSIGDAARYAGIPYKDAWSSVQRATGAYQLARLAAGATTITEMAESK